MAENSGIEWTHHTFNPWWGCMKVSPACDHCYAERDAKRYQPGRVLWGVGAERRTFGEKHWNEPRRWNERAQREDRRFRVFCASMADVFDKEGPVAERRRLFALIEATPHLDWLLLTKRIGNVANMVPSWWHSGWPSNVWLGATVVTQEEADRDIPKLLTVPARVRWLSIEPMLGPIDLTSIQRTAGQGLMRPLDGRFRTLDWIVCGGESGPGARSMHPDWARSLRDQCAAAGVPFLFKQWGEWVPGNDGPGGDLYARDRTKLESGMFTYSDVWTPGGPNPFRQTMDRVGKKTAGRLLDGVLHDGYPAAEAPHAA